MRNFEEVITQITDVLESNGFRECELAIRLHKLRKSSRYTAPEMMYERWNEAHEELCEHLLNEQGKINNDALTEMKLDIFSIFSKKDKEELRLNVVE